MAVSSKSDVAKKLAALQLTFKQQLPDKISEIRHLWEALGQNTMNDAGLGNMHRMAHSLAGSSATFGAVTVSNIAQELEKALKLFLNEQSQALSIYSVVKCQIDELLIELGQAGDKWQPSNIPFVKSYEAKKQREENLVYLVEDDELLAKDLTIKLGQADYRVQHFAKLNDFEVAIEEQMPAAILMSIVFTEGDVAGVDAIARLKAKQKNCPPVIFISARDDVEARLAAARAGARRYFCKPLDVKKLTQTLDGLTERTATKPYRILLIDDDEALLKHYSTVLCGAGMDVEALSSPLEALKMLPEFKPDIVVTDIYMPECSGLELAQVIRQDDDWALMPIMFLSVESNLNRQLEAMNLGGDDFLVKPVEANHLVAAVTARAKRARWINRLNNNLDSALRESVFQLATMNQHDIVSTADIAGRITYVNDRFCEVSGYSRDELLGENHSMLKSGYHPHSFFDEMWATISQGKVWHGTICNRRKDGFEYWVESTIVPFLDDKGEPYKYVSAHTDISELKTSEERLERSQVYADIGTWDWDIRNDEVYWSDRVKQLYGYTPELKEITSEHFFNIVHPDDLAAVTDAVKACLEHGVKFDIEHRVVWPDGSVRWLLERGDVIRSEEGELLHMLGVVQDVTERVLAEARQRETEERFAFAVEGAGDGVWDWDMRTNAMQFSWAYMKMLGYAENELPNNVDTWTKSVHADDLAQVQKKLQDYLDGQESIYAVELRLRCKDDSYKWVLCRGTVVDRDAGGKPLRMIGIHSDITKRKEAEQNLVDAREEADNANRAKSQFLSSMSHELRTPMNAIIGFGQLLKMEKDPALTESQAENVNEIIKAGDHLLELINEVLDLARIEAGRIDLYIETVALGGIIAESLQLVMPLAQRRGIKVSLTSNGADIVFEQLLQQHNTVRADRTRLRQVFVNLLSNAVKYNSENGKLTIACHHTENNQTRISITDTGEGIAPEQQAQLFKAFNRLGAERSEIEGTGIGLVITKNIVELMGGSIGVESQPGEGSTFWIELPGGTLIPAQPCAQKDVPDKTEITPASMPLSVPEHEHTVLYIEDNPANLRLVTKLLGRLGNIHMWSAHEPMLGLDLVVEHKPDLILLDINLPGMDGFEVLKHLRQREATRNTPVIAISANAMPSDIEKGLEAGFDDYVTKPIDVDALLRAVDSKLFSKYK
jgi:PAS domain S-box-containing protein